MMLKTDQEIAIEQKVVLLRLALGDATFHSMARSLKQDPRIATAHNVDIVIRKDGVEHRIEADWLKEFAKIVEGVEPP
jgi:hypothetical protein